MTPYPNKTATQYLLVLVAAAAPCLAAKGPDNNALNAPNKPFGVVQSLNGEWQIGEGALDRPPSSFPSRIPVPGLVSLARPAFEHVGEPVAARPAFWYRHNFISSRGPGDVVRLVVHMAMYGVKVFVNGRLAGENLISYSPTVLDITRLLRPAGQQNELLVRVAAHIDRLPDTVASGGESEKQRYIPGIHDDVEVITTGPLYVDAVQAAPIPEERRVRVVLDVKNRGTTRQARYTARVFDASSGKQVGQVLIPPVRVDAGSSRQIDVSIRLSEVRLWSPDSPHLYRLEVSDGTNALYTRFGMRRVSFCGRELRLNRQPYYLRGNTMALYRFFEDLDCGHLPWDPDWVRRLFRTFKSLHQNSFRSFGGPWPRFWYDIADEEGFAIFDEYAIWYAYRRKVSSGDFDALARDPLKRYGIWPEGLTAAELAEEYKRWMMERWNHASVLFWDAQNETWAPETGEAINLVRTLDLSGRPWDNGWSPPAGPGDYREAHPYFESRAGRPIQMDDMPRMERIPGTFYAPYQRAYRLPLDGFWDRPVVINEYGNLWLNRDGTATEATRAFYDAALGAGASASDRRRLYARYLAAATEYWRASRTCFGVLYLSGLAFSKPGTVTSDNFIDVPALKLDEFFLDYMRDAFSPLAVMIDEWRAVQPKGKQIEVALMVTNDTADAAAGSLSLKVLRGQDATVAYGQPFRVAAWGQQRLYFKVQLPVDVGRYTMIAELAGRDGPVRSRREFQVE